jgi:hypothetical protein
MVKARTLVGLDVHAAKIVAAVLDVETGEVRSFRLPGDVSDAVRLCLGLARRVGVTYQAGPTGSGEHGRLRSGAELCLRDRQDPSGGGDRVKTDRRDAEHSRGCCWPASCTRSGSPGRTRRRCATSTPLDLSAARPSISDMRSCIMAARSWARARRSTGFDRRPAMAKSSADRPRSATQICEVDPWMTPRPLRGRVVDHRRHVVGREAHVVVRLGGDDFAGDQADVPDS